MHPRASIRRAAPLAALAALVISAAPPAHADSNGVWHELGPPARSDAGFVYDPVRDRMLVVGGSNGTLRRDVLALSFEPAPGWAQLSVSGTGPPPRSELSAIYDPVRDRVLVFGGYADPGINNEVWSLSLSDPPTWTQLTPAGAPPAPRCAHSAIYDSNGDRMVVYGGRSDTDSVFADAWALSLSGTPTWSLLSSGGPPARAYPGAVYDPAGNRMIVCGGWDPISGTLDDAWSLSLDGSPTWTSLPQVPAGVAGGLAILDPVRQRVLVQGYTAGSMWALSLNGTLEWSAFAPGGSPPPVRVQQEAIYDPARDRMVMHGGRDNTVMSDTWQVDLSSSSPEWSPLILSHAPPARTRHVAVLDPAGRRMIVFGGNDEAGLTRNDTWILSLGTVPTWMQVVPAAPGGMPVARTEATGIYDPVRNRLIVFGGSDGNFTHAYLNDAWALTLDATPTWTNLNPAGTKPSGRRFAAAAYDPVGDRMILYGGNTSSGADRTTRELTLGTTPTWTLLSALVPSSRMGTQLVLDSEANRLVLFGGGPDGSHFLNDTWAFPLDGTADWSPIQAGGTLPTAREFHSEAFDALRDRLVIYGGWGHLNSINIGLFSDADELSLGDAPNWSQLAPAGDGPGARQHHSTLYDADMDRLVLYGGEGGGPATSITWTLDFMDTPAPAPASVLTAERQGSDVVLAWQGREPWHPGATLYRKSAGQAWNAVSPLTPDGANQFHFQESPAGSGAVDYALAFDAEPGAQIGQIAHIAGQTTDVPGATAAFAIRDARFTAAAGMEVSFALPGDGPARLDLFDLAGRRLAGAGVGDLGPGEHRVRLAAADRLASGIYWVRLERGAESRLRKVIALR